MPDPAVPLDRDPSVVAEEVEERDLLLGQPDERLALLQDGAGETGPRQLERRLQQVDQRGNAGFARTGSLGDAQGRCSACVRLLQVAAVDHELARCRRTEMHPGDEGVREGDRARERIPEWPRPWRVR